MQTLSLASGSSATKLKLDSLDRFKACWALRGFLQEQNVDFDEMFSPVVKPRTMHIIFSLALSLKRETCQLNFKNTFLHGTLSEVVYYRKLITPKCKGSI
jgi:hypothetical protein